MGIITSDKAGIYSADSYMRSLVDWCIETEHYTITRAELPDDLKCKWYRRSIAYGYLKRVNDTKSSSGDTWKPSGIYLKLLNDGMGKKRPLGYSAPLSIDITNIAISEGHVTCRQISDYLGFRFTTTFQALKKYHAVGLLDRVSVRNIYHYSIKEN